MRGKIEKVPGTDLVCAVWSLAEWFAAKAEREDAMPQLPLLEPPDVVMADEDGFRRWADGKDAGNIFVFERWFRERTGVVVCAAFSDGFGYRPAHVRDEKGVWRTWGKYPKWLTRMLHQTG